MHGTSDQGWFYIYLCVGWFGHMCHGMSMAILGPAQPYLAQNVGVLNEQINFIWTGRGFGSCLAAVMTGLVFKSLLRKRWQKLLFLGSFILCAGVFVGLVPWVTSFKILMPALLTAGFSSSCFHVGNSAFTVFMLGPEGSAPFMQALNALVGVGFMFGSLIVRPFLPEQEEDSSICGNSKEGIMRNFSFNGVRESSDEGNVYVDELVETIPAIVWPFMIIASVHIFTGLAIFVLAISKCPLPEYEEKEEKTGAELCNKIEKEEKNILEHPYILLFLSFLFFTISSGTEGFFISQSYTFGICGPHKMIPAKAASLTTAYFSCFLAGRLFGVFLASRLQAHVMIIGSQIGCFLSAFLLVMTASSYIDALFIGTGAMGFFISLQFASGFSWLAKQVDMAGKKTSIPSFGANSGFLSFPPIAGAIFFSWIGPVGIYYLTLGLSGFHILLFLSMLKVASKKCSL